MDKITRDILVILLSQQQKFRNDIEELRKEIIAESNMAIQAIKHVAEILPAVQKLNDPAQKKAAMKTLFLALEKTESNPQVDRAIAKIETSNDTLAAHTLGLVNMLKSIQFGEEEV